MRLTILYVAIACFIAGLLVALAADSARAAEAADGTPAMVATNRNGESKEVRPLDDPENPYRDRYGAWDLWIWDNYQPDFNPRDFSFTREDEEFRYTSPDGRELPPGWCYDNLQVDEHATERRAAGTYGGRVAHHVTLRRIQLKTSTEPSTIVDSVSISAEA